MKETFWLLDVNYEVKDHDPEVWIWGIKEDGKRILVIDRNFLPYFYLEVAEKEDPQAVMKQIEAQRADFPLIDRLETVDRRSFGRPVKAIKVTCRDPDLVERYSKRLSKIRGVKGSFEDDMRYSMRYLIDNDVTPCGWHEVEAEKTENTWGVQVDQVFLAESFPKLSLIHISEPTRPY